VLGSREALLDDQLGRVVDPNVPEELVEASFYCAMARLGSETIVLIAHFKRHRMLDGTDSKRLKP
jgi:hypothetical protein